MATSPGGEIVLWFLVISGAVALAIRRFAAAMSSPVGFDLTMFYLPAARSVAEGRSPYEVPGYVYSPVVAWLLAPVADRPWVVTGWVAAMILVGMSACLVVALAATRGQGLLSGAVVFGVACVTLMGSWPFTMELFMGQADMLVLLFLSLAMWAEVARRRVTLGISLGVAALVKTWPAGFLIWLVRAPLRGSFRERRREWLGVAGAAILGVVTATISAGPRGAIAMVEAAAGASDQPLIAYSASGAGKLLFAETGLVVPIVVSPIARWVLTGVLSALILGLLVVTLARPRPPMIALANVVFCVVLLLPVSHYIYLALLMPALWWWTARVLASPREWRSWVAVSALGVWWLVAMRHIPGGEVYTRQTWQSYLLVLVPTVVAATASVVCSAGIRTESSQAQVRA